MLKCDIFVLEAGMKYPESTMPGIDIIIPYFVKVLKLYFTFCLLTKSVNIIPAKAPIGVKKAPILDPMIIL